jgi:hypothetical protein
VLDLWLGFLFVLKGLGLWIYGLEFLKIFKGFYWCFFL